MVNITKYETASGVRWELRYRKPDGKQTRKRGFSRKIDAERWAAENVTTAIASNRYIDPSQGSIKVRALWPMALSLCSATRKPSTVANFSGAQTRIFDKWADWKVRDITKPHVQEWALSLMQDDGLAPGTAQHYVIVLKQILDVAIEHRAILDNPAAGIRLPRSKQRKRDYLTAEQLMMLADSADSEQRRLVILMLGVCGLRFSELAGLRVEDVDLVKHRIHVRRAAVQINMSIHEGTPKSGHSRSVAYPAFLQELLVKRMEGRSASDLLFTGSVDGHMPRPDPNGSGSWYERAKRKAGFGDSRMTIHDLRHTAASLMIHAGANVKAVQRQLGHASASMTLDVYADLFEDDLDAVADSMDLLLSDVAGSGKCVQNVSKTTE